MVYDLIIIGGGPAGLTAAKEAYEEGVRNMLIIERDKELGGILNQCIHNGFGILKFNEELTGPEYAGRYIDFVEEKNIDYLLHSIVLDLREIENGNKIVECASMDDGYLELEAKTVILAMGARERTRMMIETPGFRPAGVFNAGLAQKYLNIDGYKVGKKVVILGSGDIGLIMARRLTLTGAKVERVVEIEPYTNGLQRNVAQCLDDFGIPLQLSHTIAEIKGKDRVESVVIAEVDKNYNIIEGTEEEVECDTVLFSVGLIPENELSRNLGVDIDKATKGPIVNNSLETNIPGVFACGNVLHIHDVVDLVSDEAEEAAKNVVSYLNAESKEKKSHILVKHDKNIGYVVPQVIEDTNKHVELKFRVRKPSGGISFVVEDKDGNEIIRKKRWATQPSEMEKLIIPKTKFEKIEDTINIRVEGEDIYEE
ncbi:pyridine nucleotide-disulfide oxidoreductase [Anaerococcus hydrogenalis DSM 7454]|uniref:Pyridine nucleotide-disulfide oxidoreductase n=1 Tax=Anaerococcus hydrogenalis DSM 7454 TaxID=561177 RepID=B6WB13_9FIRM|nr:NAD(P)/FAD-dependent oxidoreductase [Anaerococcus hydrogenalis]EEB35282.1 pyridine nucleotide-disulfide oxidoreductase [Anaerococcus hydrogenalis DSM 7454]